MKLRLKAKGCHLPFGIKQCYLTQVSKFKLSYKAHNVGDKLRQKVNTPCLNTSQRPLSNLPTPDEWKAELT